MPTGEKLEQCVPFIDDYCKNCGTDMRIKRCIVDCVPVDAVLRLTLGAHGFLSMTEHECALSDDDAEKFGAPFTSGEAFCDGMEYITQRICGLDPDLVELVGIAVDGSYLYCRKPAPGDNAATLVEHISQIVDRGFLPSMR